MNGSVGEKKKLEFSVNVALCTYDGSSSSERFSLLSNTFHLIDQCTKSQKNNTIWLHAVCDVLEEESLLHLRRWF